MKSGLFGSRLSAMNATLTPAPVASCWAFGLPSVVSALIDRSASGSTSGLRRVGRADGAAGRGVRLAVEALALALGPAAGGAAAGGETETSRSGTTDATAGSAASAAAWAAVTVAAKALPSA